jgi:hypothetical protein
VVAIALKTIGGATRFFLTRHWVRARIGPYVVTTCEVRPSAYETTVTWGEAGPQVEQFGSGLAFDLEGAEGIHEEVCERVECEAGLKRLPDPRPPAA